MNEDEINEESKKLAAGPLGEMLAKFPLLFAHVTFFGPRPSKIHPSEIRSGTISIVDLGAGPFAVTCEHVIAAYCNMKETHDNLVFQISNIEIDPLEQLIDKNARLDLATIHLSKEQLVSITSGEGISSSVFMPKSWPPDAIKDGDFVSFGGFPGSLRSIVSFDEYIFESWSCGGSKVSSVSEGQFVSAFEREKWVKSFGAEHHLTLDALGGLSGGPVFINRGLYSEFVGIVSQYHENYDAMFFSSASNLRANGTIIPLP